MSNIINGLRAYKISIQEGKRITKAISKILDHCSLCEDCRYLWSNIIDHAQAKPELVTMLMKGHPKWSKKQQILLGVSLNVTLKHLMSCPECMQKFNQMEGHMYFFKPTVDAFMKRRKKKKNQDLEKEIERLKSEINGD